MLLVNFRLSNTGLTRVNEAKAPKFHYAEYFLCS